MHRKRETCRTCEGRDLACFLSLGPQPLANALIAPGRETDPEPSFPLDVYLCRDCGLVQLLDVIDPDVLFRDYVYLTGTSSTIADHNRRYAERVQQLLGLGGDDLVVEAASNDGSLLRCFQALNLRTLGVEPARNIAALARASGVDTVEEFFGLATAREVRAQHGAARAVIGNNVLAHVDDPRDFLAGAAELVADDGLVVTEVPYLGEMVDRLEYDTIYHEHLCYFSVTALLRLAEAAGLRIARVERYGVHGGTIRVYYAPARTRPDHAGPVLAMAEAEARAGLTGLPRFERFREDVEANRARLVGLLGELRAAGHSMAGYGAPAKGNTLLNYCGIGTDLLPYTVDKSPLKLGKLTPGRHLPILPVRTLLERQPDFVLILAWNFAGEIMAQQAEYRRRGGRFILPIPEPEIR